ncbi:hypothetical protein H8356DRAFT_1425735 [Neocallimastix lanati (nom. inval.)]|nr:hypothetical protein H8356DRAFT_1425735 [Neocallimastix sp. JGI-2020a]
MPSIIRGSCISQSSSAIPAGFVVSKSEKLNKLSTMPILINEKQKDQNVIQKLKIKKKVHMQWTLPQYYLFRIRKLWSSPTEALAPASLFYYIISFALIWAYLCLYFRNSNLCRVLVLAPGIISVKRAADHTKNDVFE